MFPCMSLETGNSSWEKKKQNNNKYWFRNEYSIKHAEMFWKQSNKIKKDSTEKCREIQEICVAVGVNNNMAKVQ